MLKTVILINVIHARKQVFNFVFVSLVKLTHKHFKITKLYKLKVKKNEKKFHVRKQYGNVKKRVTKSFLVVITLVKKSVMKMVKLKIE